MIYVDNFFTVFVTYTLDWITNQVSIAQYVIFPNQCLSLWNATNLRKHQRIQLSNAMQVPVWSAYNSLISDTLDITRSATPPLIGFPAHEWSTLLTVLKQAQDINTLVVGADRKTVVTLDLGLNQQKDFRWQEMIWII